MQDEHKAREKSCEKLLSEKEQIIETLKSDIIAMNERNDESMKMMEKKLKQAERKNTILTTCNVAVSEKNRQLFTMGYSVFQLQVVCWRVV